MSGPPQIRGSGGPRHGMVLAGIVEGMGQGPDRREPGAPLVVCPDHSPGFCFFRDGTVGFDRRSRAIASV